jgi:hypothetical protein
MRVGSGRFPLLRDARSRAKAGRAFWPQERRRTRAGGSQPALLLVDLRGGHAGPIVARATTARQSCGVARCTRDHDPDGHARAVHGGTGRRPDGVGAHPQERTGDRAWTSRPVAGHRRREPGARAGSDNGRGPGAQRVPWNVLCQDGAARAGGPAQRLVSRATLGGQRWAGRAVGRSGSPANGRTCGGVGGWRGSAEPNSAGGRGGEAWWSWIGLIGGHRFTSSGRGSRCAGRRTPRQRPGFVARHGPPQALGLTAFRRPDSG